MARNVAYSTVRLVFSKESVAGVYTNGEFLDCTVDSNGRGFATFRCAPSGKTAARKRHPILIHEFRLEHHMSMGRRYVNETWRHLLTFTASVQGLPYGVHCIFYRVRPDDAKGGQKCSSKST